MPATVFCANHPTSSASHRCKKCGKDICQKCVLITDIGAFCGKACYEEVVAFQARVNALSAGRRPPGMLANLLAWAKQLVVLALVVGGAWAYFHFAHGASTPQEIVNVVKGMLGM